jgi:hypothetical protein
MQSAKNQHIINRSPLATDLTVNENLLWSANCQPLADDMIVNENLLLSAKNQYITNRSPMATN